MPEQELTWGEKQAGVTFNPSQDPTVAEVKERFAGLMDLLNDLRSQSDDGDVKRFYSMSLTELNHAQMDAVKAVTWRF
jgi:hypothetical protein